MKNVLRFTLIIFLFNALIYCEKDDTIDREFPAVLTLPVSNITSQGATFNAEFKYYENFELLEYGFIWGIKSQITIGNADKVIVKSGISKGKINANISTALKEQTKYYVRSYIKTDAYMVYGATVEFISLGSNAPIINKVKPMVGTIGDTVRISGIGFSYIRENNEVLFNNNIAEIVNSTDTIITAIVPTLDSLKASIAVSVVGNISTVNENFNITTPQIVKFYPESLAIDDTITIVGSNFSLDLESNILFIGNHRSNVVFAKKDSIKAIIPPNLDAVNNISVGIAGQQCISDNKFSFLFPKVNSVSTNMVAFADTISFYGENLSSVIKSNKIFFEAIEAEVICASKDSIQFIVPNELSRADNKIKYYIAGKRPFDDYVYLKSPIINSIEKTVYTECFGENIEIHGENFNPDITRNSVYVDYKSTKIISSSKSKIIVQFPTSLIPNSNISTFDTCSVHVNILGQTGSLVNSIIVDYQSIWTKMKKFPGHYRYKGASFSLNGKGYIGLGTEGTQLGSSYNDFWEYNPDNDSWVRLQDFPGIGRSSFSLFTIENKAFVVGGVHDLSYENDTILKDVWVFNGDDKSWDKKSDFPGKARVRPFGFSIQNEGYMGGGLTISDLWKYNASIDKWTQLKDIEKIWTSDMHGISNNEFGFVLALDRENKKIKIWRYSKEEDDWTLGSSSSGRFENASGIFIDNYFYLGRGDGGKTDYYNYILRYNSLNNVWNYFDVAKGEFLMGSFSIGPYGYFVTKDNLWKLDPSKL